MNEVSHADAVARRRIAQIADEARNDRDPSLDDMRAAFLPMLAAAREAIADFAFVTVGAQRPPWTATSLTVDRGQHFTILPTGRMWRSRPQDLWIRPQLGLWCRVGEAGRVFNGTRDTNTFAATAPGRIYLANQFPGQFADPGGRVQNLHAYDTADGAFAVLVIVWRDAPALERLRHDPFGLVAMEQARLARAARTPEGWNHLWFVGETDIFEETACGDARCIHCRTHGTVGILQKEAALPLAPDTVLSWDWRVDALPSRLPEDTATSHDYLSVAVEFENGRDITYFWSHELPVGTGFWCPLPSWADREFHVVVRSGAEGLGAWRSERRNLYEDYKAYIGAPPSRIVRVWLIASSRWQRLGGEMQVKALRVACAKSAVLNLI